jgi:hypothetical protein
MPPQDASITARLRHRLPRHAVYDGYQKGAICEFDRREQESCLPHVVVPNDLQGGGEDRVVGVIGLGKRVLPLQPGLTEYVPERFVALILPPKLAVILPVTFPAESKVNLPTAALDPIPTIVSLSENPLLPEARVIEHAPVSACAAVAMLSTNATAKRIRKAIDTILRFIVLPWFTAVIPNS